MDCGSFLDGPNLEKSWFCLIKPLFLQIRLLALESLPGPVLASKNLPKTLKNRPRARKNAFRNGRQKRGRILTAFFRFGLRFGSQNGAQKLRWSSFFALQVRFLTHLGRKQQFVTILTPFSYNLSSIVLLLGTLVDPFRRSLASSLPSSGSFLLSSGCLGFPTLPLQDPAPNRPLNGLLHELPGWKGAAVAPPTGLSKRVNSNELVKSN